MKRKILASIIEREIEEIEADTNETVCRTADEGFKDTTFVIPDQETINNMESIMKRVEANPGPKDVDQARENVYVNLIRYEKLFTGKTIKGRSSKTNFFVYKADTDQILIFLPSVIEPTREVNSAKCYYCTTEFTTYDTTKKTNNHIKRCPLINMTDGRTIKLCRNCYTAAKMWRNTLKEYKLIDRLKQAFGIDPRITPPPKNPKRRKIDNELVQPAEEQRMIVAPAPLQIQQQHNSITPSFPTLQSGVESVIGVDEFTRSMLGLVHYTMVRMLQPVCPTPEAIVEEFKNNVHTAYFLQSTHYDGTIKHSPGILKLLNARQAYFL